MDLFYKFTINAARRLPNLPDDHICNRLHGHTFGIEIVVRGEVEATTGWVVDFAELDRPIAEIKAALEHRYLNDVEGLSNPTSEVLAIWLWQKISAAVDGLHKVEVCEGADRGCTYYGPLAG